MTREEREEALNVLTDMANALHLIPTTRQGKAFKMVLQELQKQEQEPCGDCISREDALMALTGEYTESPIEILSKAIRRIRTLPPVTPQYTEAEIQKMQDFEYAEIQMAYEIGKEEGSSENPNKWIPVSERLPKGYERVLVTRRMFHWANEPVEYTVGMESFSGNVDFVAWMPLPEPYTEGGEQNE